MVASTDRVLFLSSESILEVGSSRMGQPFNNAIGDCDSVFSWFCHLQGGLSPWLQDGCCSSRYHIGIPRGPKAFSSQGLFFFFLTLGLTFPTDSTSTSSVRILSRDHHWLECEGGVGSGWCWMSYPIVSTVLPECPKEQADR